MEVCWFSCETISSSKKPGILFIVWAMHSHFLLSYWWYAWLVMFTTSHHFPQISPESGAGEIQIFWNDGSRRYCHMLSLQSENQFPRLSGLWVAVTWFSDLKTKQLKNLKLKDLIIIHYPNKILERQPCGIGLYHLSLSPFRYLIGFNHHKCWFHGTHLQVAILFCLSHLTASWLHLQSANSTRAGIEYLSTAALNCKTSGIVAERQSPLFIHLSDAMVTDSAGVSPKFTRLLQPPNRRGTQRSGQSWDEGFVLCFRHPSKSRENMWWQWKLDVYHEEMPFTRCFHAGATGALLLLTSNQWKKKRGHIMVIHGHPWSRYQACGMISLAMLGIPAIFRKNFPTT